MQISDKTRAKTRWTARGAAVFCAAFAGFQAALALGAPFGRMTWGGQSDVLPNNMRAASAGAAAYLLLAGAAMLVRSRDWGRRLPQAPFRWFNVLLTIQLALNTAANLASQTAAEKFGMGSATAIGFGLCLFAAIPKRLAD
ncbi:hypothetical protein BH11PSE2_BH11PSE2_05040 [soil metagenome]